MNTRNVNEIFISDGATINTDGANITAITSQLSFVNSSMVTMAGAGHTITTDPAFYAVNKLANGDLKRSFPVKGTSITSWEGAAYAAATKEVWSVGYSRLGLAGSIKVNNDTLYNLSVRFKWDKQFFSERPEMLRISFTSAASATELSIANQITDLINNSGYGSQPAGIKVIKAVTVGNASGPFGLTGASAYGVEIWALDVNQFANTTYKPLRVYFSVQVDDASGFETTTTCTQIQANSYGTGTLEQVYGIENYNYQFEGVLNRTKWPIPTLAYLTSTSLFVSGTLAAFTATVVANSDLVTFTNPASTELPAGSFLTINGVAHEIKYYIDSTHAILVNNSLVSAGGLAVVGKAGYDIYNISINDVTTGAGANMGMFANKAIMIASPAISGAPTTMATKSASSTAIEAVLNPYMTSTPPAFTTVVL